MLVDAVKYAPLGRRGMTPGRANAYAVSGMSSKEYIEASNRETMVPVQIEDVEGVENLPEILKVEGVDIVVVGPGDLSASLGYPGQRSHPKVLEVIEQIIDQVYAAGKISNNVAPDAETRKRWFEKGGRLIGVGDLRLLYDSTVARLEALRESVQ